jgi:predicted amidohydrolase
MGQMLVEGGDPGRNLERAVGMIHRAREEGCSVVVLPECLDLGWTHPSARELAQPIPGRYSSMLCDAAASAGVYVAAGLTEGEGDRLYNAAVLISPEGEILRKHRKINELDFARELYTTGGSLAVTETALGTIGLNICADNSPDSLVLGHSLGRIGARLLLSPSAWAVPADHDNTKDPYGAMWRESYTALAKQHGMTVVGVSNVGWMTGGAWQGWKCIGCSLAVGPNGTILAEGPYGEAAEALLVVSVETPH